MSFKRNFFRFIFISVLGVLLHFTYDWSNQNSLIGLFSATNESTFEHLKLIFFPMLLLTILELYFNKDNLPENFLGSRTIGIIGGMIFIVVAFYTILGVLGQNYDFINIAIYFAGVIFALWLENKLYSKSYISNSTGTKILIFTTLLFFLFTFYPPKLGLFIDPTLQANLL
jgi:hypothetical protein